jgi:hypothetical protein
VPCVDWWMCDLIHWSIALWKLDSSALRTTPRQLLYKKIATVYNLMKPEDFSQRFRRFQFLLSAFLHEQRAHLATDCNIWRQRNVSIHQTILDLGRKQRTFFRPTWSKSPSPAPSATDRRQGSSLRQVNMLRCCLE